MTYQAIRDYELDIILRAWKDEDFRQRLIKDPKTAIAADFNLKIPDDLEISVREEDDHKIHLIVPAKPSNIAANKMSEDDLLHKIHDLLADHHLGSWPASRKDMEKEIGKNK